jgi:hypothetical protein
MHAACMSVQCRVVVGDLSDGRLITILRAVENSFVPRSPPRPHVVEISGTPGTPDGGPESVTKWPSCPARYMFLRISLPAVELRALTRM